MRKQRLWGLLAVTLLITACGSPAATGTPNPTATPAATATQAASATPPATATTGSSATASAPASETPGSTTALPSGVPTSIGPGEGALTVLNWPGYVEDGTTDPSYDWVTPFETETGCQVETTPFGTSDAAFNLFTTNPEQFDVISASGDASKRLAAAGYVQPVNVDLLASYAEIYSSLKDQPYNTFDGVHYGIAHGRGSNQMMWLTANVNPAPTSWMAMFDPNSDLRVSVYDAPIYIADAAVILMKTKPELGITNPYALDETQFAAAIALLQDQRPTVKHYWTDYADQIAKFQNNDVDIGTTWQVIANILLFPYTPDTEPTDVQLIKPSEGATGWSDTWMINSKTKHINCAYMFLNYITSAPVNIQIAEYFGEAPGNSKSCDLSTIEGFCEQFHAGDDDPFWDDVHYWQTPEAACVDGRTDVQCKDFDDWVDAWTTLKG